MGISLCSGQKGRLKASRREFEIVSTTSATTMIRFRGERHEIEVKDADLKDAAENIETWSSGI